jgi:predicted nucleic acid-binding Zn ribbon protein
MTDPPVKKCPRCDGTVKRLLGAGAGIIFKGSGFYITDYRSESYKKDAEKEKKPESSEKKEGDSKTEGTEKKNSN